MRLVCCTWVMVITMLSALVSVAPEASAHPRKSAAARSGIPPFCVLIELGRGRALPQICRFYDYQQCLQAAADLRGNCVINIDYPGEITGAPGANWSRPPR